MADAQALSLIPVFLHTIAFQHSRSEADLDRSVKNTTETVAPYATILV